MHPDDPVDPERRNRLIAHGEFQPRAGQLLTS